MDSSAKCRVKSTGGSTIFPIICDPRVHVTIPKIPPVIIIPNVSLARDDSELNKQPEQG